MTNPLPVTKKKKKKEETHTHIYQHSTNKIFEKLFAANSFITAEANMYDNDLNNKTKKNNNIKSHLR